MTIRESTDREDFQMQLAREFPTIGRDKVWHVAKLIMRNAATLQRLAEMACNRDLTASEEKREQTAERHLRDAVSQLPGLSVIEIGGDPRGYVVKLKLPSGAYNTWGGEECGWGVPA